MIKQPQTPSATRIILKKGRDEVVAAGYPNYKGILIFSIFESFRPVCQAKAFLIFQSRFNVGVMFNRSNLLNF